MYQVLQLPSFPVIWGGGGRCVCVHSRRNGGVPTQALWVMKPLVPSGLSQACLLPFDSTGVG